MFIDPRRKVAQLLTMIEKQVLELYHISIIAFKLQDEYNVDLPPSYTVGSMLKNSSTVILDFTRRPQPNQPPEPQQQPQSPYQPQPQQQPIQIPHEAIASIYQHFAAGRQPPPHLTHFNSHNLNTIVRKGSAWPTVPHPASNKPGPPVSPPPLRDASPPHPSMGGGAVSSRDEVPMSQGGLTLIFSEQPPAKVLLFIVNTTQHNTTQYNTTIPFFLIYVYSLISGFPKQRV